MEEKFLREFKMCIIAVEYKVIFSSLLRILFVANLSADLLHGAHFMDIILVGSSIASSSGHRRCFVNDGTYLAIFQCCKNTSKGFIFSNITIFKLLLAQLYSKTQDAYLLTIQILCY